MNSGKIDSPATISDDLASQAMSSGEIVSPAVFSGKLTSPAIRSDDIISDDLASQAISSRNISSQAMNSGGELESLSIISGNLASQATSSGDLKLPDPETSGLISSTSTGLSPPAKKTLTDWSTLPCDLLEVISRRLETIFDYVGFRSVCTSWRSAAPKRPQFPWILLEYTDQHEDIHLELYDLPDTETLYNPPLLEELDGRYIRGSARGWIVFMDKGSDISLRNLFTGGHICLPHHTDLLDAEYLRVVLSSDPTRGDCEVTVYCIEAHSMFHCRIGDSSWTKLEIPLKDLHHFHNIVFYKGKFYATSNSYRVFVCEFEPDACVREVLPADPLFADGQTREGLFVKTYLVESSGDLLLVAITYRECHCSNVYCDECEPIRFEVFRVDLDVGQMKLFKLEDVGGRALYLCSESMAVSAGDSPLCKGNCVYFIPNDLQGTHHITIFSMEDDKIDSFEMGWRPVHWFTPSLC